MGVETTAYSIPPKMMRKIRRNFDLLNNIFEFEADQDAAREWQFQQYNFGTVWDEIIGIIGNCYPKIEDRLQVKEYWDYPDLDSNYDIWTVTPSAVRRAAEDLAPATFEELKKRGLELKTKDVRRGNLIPEQFYSSYVGNLEEFKKFLNQTADAGNYLLFAEA